MFFKLSANVYALPIEIRGSESGYRILMEFPGSARNDIKVWTEKDVLTIVGAKKIPENDQGDRLISERVFGKFSRSFRIPEDADASMIEADYKDGILRVNIPKTEKAKAKNIKIN